MVNIAELRRNLYKLIFLMPVLTKSVQKKMNPEQIENIVLIVIAQQLTDAG